MKLLGFCMGILGVGLLAAASRGQDPPAPPANVVSQPSGEALDVPQTLQPVEQLTNLEHVASKQADSQNKELTAAEYSNIVKAASSYAKQIAGDDDAKYSLLCARAMDEALAVKRNLVEALEKSEAVHSSRAALSSVISKSMSRTPSVNSDRDFLKSLRQLMSRSSDPESGLTPVIPGQRIVGGRLANSGEFPDCVCIGSRNSNGDAYCCTGTLIGKNVVLTAGHCHPCAGSSTVVFVGDDISGTGQTYTGKSVQHPRYAKDNKHNDLTVIILDTDVVGVTPRRIARPNETDAATFVRAVGYGNSDFHSTGGFGRKRIADIPVASSDCGSLTDRFKYGCDKNLEMVAGMVGLKVDTCNGDSGGPVYVLVGSDPSKTESWALAGATSRATKQAVLPCGDGGVYARAERFFNDFISKVPGARW